MGKPEIEAFLTHLAMQGNVASFTQNQALNALLFLYKEVLQKEVDWLNNVTRAKKPARLPVVLTFDEVRALLLQLDVTLWLMASLLYGLGLRLMECVRLRVKDLELNSLVYLPQALARKYPNTSQELGWQYVFPVSKRSVDPRSGTEQRHHLHETVLQQAISLLL